MFAPNAIIEYTLGHGRSLERLPAIEGAIMDASEPMLPGMPLVTENEMLFHLWNECETVLRAWRDREPGVDESPHDAIVALLELQYCIVDRRRYIIAQHRQEKLPF